MKRTLLLFFISFIVSVNGFSQESNLTCNDFTPITSTLFSNLTVTSSTGILGNDEFANKSNLTDANTTNVSSWAALLGGSAWIEVEDNNATGGDVYPAGSYAGFVVEDNGLLGLLGSVEVTTYLGATEQESASGGSLLSVGLLNSQARLGFYTSLPFDRVRFSVNSIGLALSVNVYYLEVRKLCSGSSFATCGNVPGAGELANNTDIEFAGPHFPAVISDANTGFGGVVIGSINNTQNALDSDPNTFAELDLNVALAGSVSFSVMDSISNNFSAGTFAGFDLEFTSLVDLELLGGITIQTFVDGNSMAQNSFTGPDLLTVNSGLVNGYVRQTIGFVTTLPFDEVQIIINNTLGVSLGITRVYNAVIKNFCSGNMASCGNTQIATTNADYPVYIDWNHTGQVGLACVGCAIDNTNNVIDSDPNNWATVVLAATVGSGLELTVAHEIDEFGPGSFAGFEIATASLLDVNILASSTITLYNNGIAVQSTTGNGLLVGANTTLLEDGLFRQPVGVVYNGVGTFDAVGISFESLVSADVGEIRIYNALFSDNCAGTLQCFQSTFLTQTDFPAYINSENTGVSGLVGSSVINDAWNLVNNDLTDYAEVAVTADVLGGTSISVVDAVSEYPAGTIAGYTIETTNNALVGLDLLEGITITTYNNGIFQESAFYGSNLLGLDLLGILQVNQTDQFSNVGFITTLPFDEIQITFAGVAGINIFDNPTRVYGAFVDTRYITSGPFACPQSILNPDFNETYINVTTTGDVSTNDQSTEVVTYGTTPVPDANNPVGATINMNSDGTYDFTSTMEGVYNYTIEACVTNGPSNPCDSTILQITVNDINDEDNPPFVNPDYGTGLTGNDIVIQTLENDGPGNPGSAIDTTSVTILENPKNGMASVGPDGDITYTPNGTFVGMDTLTYQVCDDSPAPGPHCGTAIQVFTVYPQTYDNTTSAGDDFVVAEPNTVVTGNVSLNDTDPEGNNLNVTAQNTSVPGVGDFMLNTDGTYMFTPAPGFSGPYSFEYESCDDGMPQACATATLYLMVRPNYNLSTDFNSTFIDVPVNGDASTNDDTPSGATYGTPVADANNPAVPTNFTMNSDGTYTFEASTPGVYWFNVPTCVTNGPSMPCDSTMLVITVNDNGSQSNTPYAHPDYGVGKENETITVKTLENDATGNPAIPLDTSSVTIITGPTNGSASIASNGDITYTPDPDFVGSDTLTYQVCDNAPAPGPNCEEAIQVFNVVPDNSLNMTVAADDFKSSQANLVVSGNVLNNDTDPEGDNQSTTPQNITTPEGTFDLDNSGNYTFTPVVGYTGPASYVYEKCDDATPQACDTATAYFMINPPEASGADMTIGVSTGVVSIGVGGNTDINYNVTNVGSGATIGSTEITFNRRTDHGTLTPTTVPAGWTLVQTTTTEYKYSTAKVFAASGGTSEAFTFNFTHDGDPETLFIVFRGTVSSGSGGETNNFNNFDTAKIQVNQ